MNAAADSLTAPILTVRGLDFFHGQQQILGGVDLEVPARQVTVLVGPSGCGKSTLLRIFSGLETPQAGTVDFRSQPGAHGARLAYLFQDYDSFPWMTVEENVREGSGPQPYPAREAVEQILTEVGLADHRHKYPAELSGGMRKRLGLARCLVRRPSLLLLDEPFSSLDMATRAEMYALVQRLMRETACTIVLVSHDLHEALLLGDRLLVCSTRPMHILESIGNTLPHPRTPHIVQEPFYRETHERLIAALRLG